MPVDSEYQAYLCSREWAVKREAVRERARGKCERCCILPMDACHHLTYERKYAERLEDLQAICTPCHEFTHGKAEFNPLDCEHWLKHLKYQSDFGNNLPPLVFCQSGGYPMVLNYELRQLVMAIRALDAVDLEHAADILRQSLPFVIPSDWLLLGSIHMASLKRCFELFGWTGDNPEWLSSDEQE